MGILKYNEVLASPNEKPLGAPGTGLLEDLNPVACNASAEPKVGAWDEPDAAPVLPNVKVFVFSNEKLHVVPRTV